MRESLERLIYRSEAVAPGPDADLDAILQASLWNNARARITGVLGHSGGRYVQLLEEPRASLDDLLIRLDRDPRHRDVVVLDRRPANRRLLPGWTMARAELASLTGAGDVAGLLERPDAGAVLVDLLVDCVRRGETSVA